MRGPGPDQPVHPRRPLRPRAHVRRGGHRRRRDSRSRGRETAAGPRGVPAMRHRPGFQGRGPVHPDAQSRLPKVPHEPDPDREPAAASGAGARRVKAPGEILLVAGYELGHQPLALAWPAAFLENLGYHPAVMDVSVEAFDARRARRAKLVGVSVPMHTALRIGVTIIERVRAVNPDCHLCFYGLYASLNADYLLRHGADSIIGGEVEAPLGELARALEIGAATPPSVRTGANPARPHLGRVAFPVPSRGHLPPLRTYVKIERDGRRDLAGY